MQWPCGVLQGRPQCRSSWSSSASVAVHGHRIGSSECHEELAAKYSDVFASKLPPRVVRKDAITHSFVMQDGATPTRDGERRRSSEEIRLAQEMVAEGEASGIIEDSNSEWCSQLRRNGYYANPDKCEFFQERVNFLGHVISADGVAVQQHKVDAVAKWPTPQSVSDVRRFLASPATTVASSRSTRRSQGRCRI